MPAPFFNQSYFLVLLISWINYLKEGNKSNLVLFLVAVKFRQKNGVSLLKNTTFFTNNKFIISPTGNRQPKTGNWQPNLSIHIIDR